MNWLKSGTHGMIALSGLVLAITGCSKKSSPDEAAAQGSAAVEPSKEGARQPPAELVAACDGKKSGDPCSFKRGDHEITGQCTARPVNGQDQRLMCRPAHPSREQQ